MKRYAMNGKLELINFHHPTITYLKDYQNNNSMIQSNKTKTWITSLWTARDNEIHTGPTQQRNPAIITIYEQWKKKHNIE
jgi:hypothetical protein